MRDSSDSDLDNLTSIDIDDLNSEVSSWLNAMQEDPLSIELNKLIQTSPEISLEDPLFFELDKLAQDFPVSHQEDSLFAELNKLAKSSPEVPRVDDIETPTHQSSNNNVLFAGLFALANDQPKVTQERHSRQGLANKPQRAEPSHALKKSQQVKAKTQQPIKWREAHKAPLGVTSRLIEELVKLAEDKTGSSRQVSQAAGQVRRLEPK